MWKRRRVKRNKEGSCPTLDPAVFADLCGDRELVCVQAKIITSAPVI